MRICLIIVFICCLFSCESESKLEAEIAKIEVNFTIERFDKNLRNAEAKDLPKLKSVFPFLFSSQVPDSVWISRFKDTLQNQLLDEVNKVFENENDLKGDLEGLFQHLKYYDKTFSIPRIITVTNDVNYRTKNIVNDSLMLITLDNYLGSDHEFYGSIAEYLTANMKKSQVAVDVAEHYAKKYAPKSIRKDLLEEMIYFGKILYFKETVLPFKSKAEIMGYTDAQLQWAEANESAVWSYFVEHEYLYSTETKLSHRFIAEAPFTKFYLEIDKNSPGKIGQYIGWQIVKAFAKKSESGIMKILNTKSEEIFRNSNFKPRK